MRHLALLCICAGFAASCADTADLEQRADELEIEVATAREEIELTKAELKQVRSDLAACQAEHSEETASEPATVDAPPPSAKSCPPVAPGSDVDVIRWDESDLTKPRETHWTLTVRDDDGTKEGLEQVWMLKRIDGGGRSILAIRAPAAKAVRVVVDGAELVDCAQQPCELDREAVERIANGCEVNVALSSKFNGETREHELTPADRGLVARFLERQGREPSPSETCMRSCTGDGKACATLCPGSPAKKALKCRRECTDAMRACRAACDSP